MFKPIRPIRIEGNVAYATLTQGYEAIIDAEDAPLIDGRNWCVIKSRRGPYARMKIKGKTIYMHRVISECPNDMEVDHVNKNGLDNRKKNLRNVSVAENACNRKMFVNNKTGLKGVITTRCGRYFTAQIGKGNKRIYLGCFKTPEEAHAAYAAASAKLHGEYGSLG